MQPQVSFKAKIRTAHDANGENPRRYVEYKQSIRKTDCNMKPHQHTYYNSDLFEGMLRRAVKQVIGEHSTWTWLDSLPQGVSVDDTGFLATVTITLPEGFCR